MWPKVLSVQEGLLANSLEDSYMMFDVLYSYFTDFLEAVLEENL